MRRKKKLIITIITLVAIGCILNQCFQIFAISFPNNTPGHLTVLTYNIHGTGPDYPSRQEGLAQTILDQDADIVFLCEYYDKASTTLDKKLRTKYPYQDTRWAHSQSGNVLYSRYPIEQSENLSRDAYFYQVRVGDQTIRTIGCHLYSTNNVEKYHRYTLEKRSDLKTLPHYFKNYLEAQETRVKEVEALVRVVQENPMPTIVMGDMNDFGGTPVIKTLEKAGFSDAWWKGGNGLGITFREGWMRFRLDHILYDNHFELSSVRVVQSDLSDHQAMVATFEAR